ncbi:MAG TPA: lipopolysaccharide heptosyltransferase II [Candidatus Binatia bacterium]|jgi:heptosyltransferase-2
MAAVENILVAQTSFVGDVVLTTPLLAALRRRFPGARLAVLCTPSAKELLANDPAIDEIIVLKKKRDGGRRSGIFETARTLRARHFTMAISPHKSLRTALMLALAGIRLRIGFRQSAGWFLYHRRVDRNGLAHDVERNLSLLRGLGIEPEAGEAVPRVEAAPAAREAAGRVFEELGIARGDTVIGVNPGSVWPTKRWTAEGYAAVSAALAKKHGARVVVFGGPDDRQIAEQVVRLAACGAVSVAGRLSLGELAAAIDRCKVFITNDSGPMHIAVARDVPVVAIFCATTPALGFYPYSSRAVVVEKDLPCRPCGTHGGLRCPLGTDACMRLIRPEDVLMGVERLLEGDSGRDAHRPLSIAV